MRKYKTLKLTNEELDLLEYLLLGEISRCMIRLNENETKENLEKYDNVNRKKIKCENLLDIMQYLKR